jgi:hypothetical protein
VMKPSPVSCLLYNSAREPTEKLRGKPLADRSAARIEEEDYDRCNIAREKERKTQHP